MEDNTVTESDDIKLLEEYDHRHAESEPAVLQAVICIIFAAGLFILNAVSPERAGEVLEQVKTLSASEHELFSDPIEALIGLF